MNLFVKRLLCLALLVTMVAACGKKSGGGGGHTPVSNGVNVPINNNASTTTLNAFNNLKAWYQSSSEGSLPSIGQHTELRSITTYNTSDSCDKWWIFTYCVNTSSQGNTTNIPLRTVNVVASSSKSNNSKLAAVFNSSLELVFAQQYGMYGGALYTVVFKKSNNHLMIYTIDTTINSAFNPVRIEDTEAKTVEKLKKIDNLVFSYN